MNYDIPLPHPDYATGNRVWCFRQDGVEWKTKVSECLLALGEVAIEDERYEKAIEDLKSCIAIQKEVYDKLDRRIAETYVIITQWNVSMISHIRQIIS